MRFKYVVHETCKRLRVSPGEHLHFRERRRGNQDGLEKGKEGKEVWTHWTREAF